MNITLLNAVLKISCFLMTGVVLYLWGFMFIFNIIHYLIVIMFTWSVIGGFLIFILLMIVFDLDLNSLFLIVISIINIVNDIRVPVLVILVFYFIISKNYKYLFNILLRISISILFISLILIISNEILILSNAFLFMMASGGSGNGGGSGGSGGPPRDPFLPNPNPDPNSKRTEYSITVYNDPRNPYGIVPPSHTGIVRALDSVGQYNTGTVDNLVEILPNLPRGEIIRILEHERTEWRFISITVQQMPFNGTLLRHPGSPHVATIVPPRVTEFLEHDYATTMRYDTVHTLYNSNIQGRAPVFLTNHRARFMRAFAAR